ncbi:PREDICTED: C-C motif chemokine 14 isoform X1 [Colobus angolensis palliatus]|uniref:C-C motif chemokine 14 isoform X1 n=1 Tax=Colobus angolensis palliatus TaxID=336983 RepID=UPI0005F53C4B|nr:PREDICTED: C-C motif chemokine 14 isoform X1 [Colobus angolensis palliatus]
MREEEKRSPGLLRRRRREDEESLLSPPSSAGLSPPSFPPPCPQLAGPANSMAFNKGPLLSIRCSLLGGTLPPSECCLTYTTHKIPHQRIMDYYETNSQCAKPGIVFITKRGHSICTNPRDKWVQDYIKHMEEN